MDRVVGKEDLQSKYNAMSKLLENIQNVELLGKLNQMHQSQRQLMFECPSSYRGHHKWEGGYLYHVYEVMAISLRLYQSIKSLDGHAFGSDDLLLVSYVHDLEKLWKYQRATESWKLKKGQVYEYIPGAVNFDESAKVVQVCAQYGVLLNDMHLEAISHHHGGYSASISSIHGYYRKMTTLSTILHAADQLSRFIYGGEG